MAASSRRDGNLRGAVDGVEQRADLREVALGQQPLAGAVAQLVGKQLMRGALERDLALEEALVGEVPGILRANHSMA